MFFPDLLNIFILTFLPNILFPILFEIPALEFHSIKLSATKFAEGYYKIFQRDLL